MPNWSFNTLTVYGPPELLDGFAGDVEGRAEDGGTLELDFRQHIPEPASSANVIDWRVRSWGTKWLPDLSGVSRPVPEGMIYEFSTAWSPPLAWLRHVAPGYSELSFELHYEVEGDDLYRTLRISGDAEIGGYALVNRGQFSWDECRSAIEKVSRHDEEVAAVSLVGATEEGATAIELLRDWQRGDYEADKRELEQAAQALRRQLRVDLRDVAVETAHALPAPAPYSGGGIATSYLIGARPESEWRPERQRLAELLRDHEGEESPRDRDSRLLIESAMTNVEQTVPEIGGALSRLAGCGVLRHVWHGDAPPPEQA